MDINEMKNIWASQNEKIDENIRLNKTLLNTLSTNKSESEMHRVALWAIAESVTFLVIIIALGSYISHHLTFTAPTLSALVLDIFAIIGFAGSIGQFVLIKLVDYSGGVRSVQKQIYAVREHRLKIGKLLLLSIPFYMAYVFLGFEVMLGIDIYEHFSSSIVSFYAVSSALMLPFAIWLYRKLSFSNMNVRWVRWLAEELGGRQLIVAADFLGDLDEQ